MALHGFSEDDIIEYVPESERGSEDPCIVRLRFVPYSRVKHYSQVLASRIQGVTKNAKIVEQTQKVQRKQFTNSVESISGYYLGGEEVTDTGVFYDTADSDLIVEILGAMESHSKLTEGQAKNFEPPSDTNKLEAAPSSVTPVQTQIESKETAPTVTVLSEV